MKLNCSRFRSPRAAVVWLAIVGLCQFVSAQEPPPLTLTIQADQPGAKINPAMWGVFFEDINLGADGGLYAELVKNRGFEFPKPMMGWKATSTGIGMGQLSVRKDSPFNAANANYLHIVADGKGYFGVANEGFRGIGVKAGERYDFSAQVRLITGRSALRVELVSADGALLADVRIPNLSKEWELITATLKPSATEPKARLRVLLEDAGAADFDMISLFPHKTWKGRPGGLRADMVQALADLKPGFLRFPGGCIVEGSDLEKRYQWKNTIGPVEERKLLVNRWNYEFKHRPAPDYFQSFGLGFFEYFQLCEDIGAAPLPILNCGMACQFNTGQLVPLNKLDPYIQDALDLIEFATGPVTSTWGAKRAAMGHPKPFNMKLLGVGNEQWGPQYLERFQAFARVLKAKHPEITLISAAGPAPADDRFDFLWPKLVEMKAELVDQHCYANPVWFLSSANRYDSYDRNGPKVFFGEYAAQSDKIVSVDNKNNWECALSEAAFMTGMERNADVVRMASYAPLFAHVEGWQWTPNLIWVDNFNVLRTPNYHVQKLYMQHRGDVTLPVQLQGDVAPAAASGGILLSAFKGVAEFTNIVVTAGGKTLFTQNVTASGARFGSSAWRDYTVTLKARKLSGPEGFIIGFRDEKPNTRVQWNLGGSGNTRHSLQSELGEQGSLIAQVPGRIETNRWYEVKIELQGAQVRCLLDGQLVQTAEIPLPRRTGVFASAVRDEKTGEVIIKVTNVGPDAKTMTIALDGVKRVRGKARVIEMSAALNDVNAFDQPAKVAPRESTITLKGATFRREFAPNSFTVVRIKTK